MTTIYSNATPDSRQGPSSPLLPYGSDPKGYPQTFAVAVPRQTARQRFARAFLVIVFFWTLFSLLVHSVGTDLRWVHHRHWPWNLNADDDWDYIIPGDVSLEECVEGGQWSSSDPLNTENSAGVDFPYRAETSFVLPISSETLFFLSRGQKLAGAVKVVTSTDQAEDSATVRVVIRYHSEEVRDLAKACLLSRRTDENGVGFFTPVWHQGRSPRGREYDLGYNMTITLPDGSPLTINNFETDVQNTLQSIEDPNRRTFFRSVSLRGSNGPVFAESLTATKADIHTTNSPISGIFNVTDKLTLETSNSPISVHVGLKGEKAGPVPTFNAHTSNSPLYANISLTSFSGSGGSFDVTTMTSNSPLRVAFPASPVNSKLILTASTSNSPANVILHPAYEGTFNLQTTLFGSSVRQVQDVEDPSGQQRTRHVLYKGIGRGTRVVTGQVYWGEKGEAQGVVNVRTSNSPLVLQV